MQPESATASPNSPGAIAVIAQLADPVLRNRRITESYHSLGVGFAALYPGWTNWLMFAVWASKQAGQTIRGEDLTGFLHRRLHVGATLLAPVESFWRALLRRGIMNPGTLLGKLVRAIPGPLDGIERAGDAIAKGNQLIFGEIALEFARYLTAPNRSEFYSGVRGGDPPDGQDYLRRAFKHYESAALEPDAHRRAELQYLGNLEIAWHEQVRAQSVVTDAVDGPVLAARELGRRALMVIAPPALGVAVIELAVGAGLKPLARFGLALGRQVVTEAMMSMALPGGRVMDLATNIESNYPPCLQNLQNPELVALLGSFGEVDGDCGARDWTQLTQRMRYIARLFRVFHLDESLGEDPFVGVGGAD